MSLNLTHAVYILQGQGCPLVHLLCRLKGYCVQKLDFLGATRIAMIHIPFLTTKLNGSDF